MAAIDKLKVGLYKNKLGYTSAKDANTEKDAKDCYKLLTYAEAGQIARWSDFEEWMAYPEHHPMIPPEYRKEHEYALIVVQWSDGVHTMEKAKYMYDESDNRKWLIDGNRPVGSEGVVTHWRWMPLFPREYEED